MLRRALVRALAGTAGTQVGLRLIPDVRGAVGPLDVTAGARVAKTGGTHVDVPPLGSATLRTHRGPLRLVASVAALDLERGQALLDTTGDLTAARKTITDDARHLAVRAMARSVAAGITGAAAFGALAGRRPRDAAAAAAVGAAGLATAAAVAGLTRDPGVLRDPELDGLLARAPLVLGDVQQIPANLERYRDQLTELIATGTAVYRRVAQLPEPPPADALRLVHISDIHLSPFAFPLAKALVEQYDADAVIDTGDLVDWGTPAEQALAGQIPSLGVPYVYVKGNHDSDGIADAVARQPNAVVLTVEGGPREVVGLTFVGMADPRFTPDKTTGDDHANHRVGAAGRDFAQHLKDAGTKADVALVHGPAAGRPLAGLVPLVLAGDIHRRDARRLENSDTTLLVQGSTGGSGLRGVQQDPPTPVMLSVLYLDRTTKLLWGVDEVTMAGIGGAGLQIVRRTAADLLGDPAPETAGRQ